MMTSNDKPKILAIDDLPINLLTLGSALKNEFELQVATSGEMGIALALASPPDLILLDIMMPGIDGFETCRRIKADERLKDIPVVFVTAMTELDSEARGLELGALDYIIKPIQVKTARQRIRNLLERDALRCTLAAQRDQLEAEVAARKESQQRLGFALAGSGDGIWEWNLQTHEMIVSKVGKAMFGFTDTEMSNDIREWNDRVHPEDKAHLEEDTLAYFKGKRANFSSEYRLRCKDGSWKWILTRGMAVNYSPDGHVLQMFGTQTDISERKRSEEKLKLAASVFTHAHEGIIITDSNNVIVEVNDTFSILTGYAREEAIGQKFSFLQSDRHPSEFYATMWNDLTLNGHWDGEVWNRRKNGVEYVSAMTMSAVCDESGVAMNYVALFSDITQMKQHEQQLEQIAHYDALTGLPNRVLKADRLNQALIQAQRRNTSLAVVYLDLDGFKAVNDMHGHEVGDDLLIALSERMKEALREGDTLARIGGDEFVAVLVDLEHPQDCEPVLVRLLERVASPVTLGEIHVQVSASIGVTVYPQDGAEADLLLRHADQAMYQAKQSGKNRYHFFDVNRDSEVKAQRESLDRIRLALKNREFVLYYQPKVNMRAGVVVGAEALIRWQHPERGLLSPAVFLPVIENHPLGVELGEWVIESALKQVSTWHARGLDIPVSVNISAQQFEQRDFVTRLSKLLAAHPDVQPHRLELEVLETSALEDIEQVSEVMRLCQALGVQFALDDFGTGYSSLTYLKRLPADTLKIDQSFVRDMLKDNNDLAIIQGIIGLCAAFHRHVIAEGVETVAHGTRLIALGCEYAQGYGIARPMPADDFPAWVVTWRPDDEWLVTQSA